LSQLIWSGPLDVGGEVKLGGAVGEPMGVRARLRSLTAPDPATATKLMAPRSTSQLADLVEEHGLRHIDVVAWRDLDDPEAGGSEIHAHEVLSRWAAAGVDVRLWTSRVDGAAREIERAGYRATRIAGRYAVFPRTALRGLSRRIGSGDGVVEIWNGMPFFSPLWTRGPRVVFLHHVHAEMWQMVLSRSLARLGNTIERTVAPPLYRREAIITLSETAKDEIVSRLGFSADRVTVAPPGIDARFVPGGPKTPEPLIVAVGRLVPVKRFGWFIDAMAKLRADHPNLRAVVVGEGYERPALEAQIRSVGAEGWLELSGRVNDDELVALYQRAWLVVSTSVREGWGMTLTEAGACGTPSVATRIAGHQDAVCDAESGLLVDTAEEVAAAASALLSDPDLRRRLGDGARAMAQRRSWDQTALVSLGVLADEVTKTRGQRLG
jgi:glycosyltransferase involved in cell wall biosynthesis